MTRFRAKAIVVASLGLALAGMVFAPGPLEASMHKIKITDTSGASEVLTHPDFRYSDENGNYMGQTYDPYLEVIATTSPRRSSWIYNSKITIVTFQFTMPRPKASVRLDDGQVISGSFPDASLEIEGAGELGRTTYQIKNIRSIEFVEFCAYPDQGEHVLDRSAAFQRSLKEQERIPAWTVVDGSSTFTAPGLFLRDSYSTTQRGNAIYYNRLFREHHLYRPVGHYPFEGWLTVERGTSSVDVPMIDLEAIEITGHVVGGQPGSAKPEIRITKRGGTPQTAALPFADRGSFDEDDMLVWQTPYGLEGLSLRPLRRIVLTQETTSNIR